VFYTIIRIVQNKQTRRFILEGQIIETIRTIAPAVILVFIALVREFGLPWRWWWLSPKHVAMFMSV